ncbi:putative MFS family arabinose efflux permease [Flavobacterium cutihirudinis]|uniref:Putative MFS family arabinose efflux permease n=1 Tax=Flavobacterium cutihirudinis TaxID=1265740 RepID=A0A3D9G0Y7_9FLAO|nr:MFS transporter [Flavobacterium cutihirudinis]RED26900.1 putative MFS family arabinose efflux permease [Flavobacterium cutihirudinis]
MLEKEKSIYTFQFILLCLSSLLFSSSFNMMIPELPNYLSSLGGAEYKGLIISLFTLTAAISRPFSGKLTDKWGRVPVMAIGSSVCVICGFLYPILSSVSGFLLLRLVHGFSTGFKPTSTSAYVADIIPQKRWGEALGMHGLCFSIGGALGPALGSMIVNAYGMNVMFYSSSFLAFLSIIIVFNMKETLIVKEKLNKSMFYIGRKDIVDRNVFPAGIITFLSYTAFGLILTLIPDWSEHLGAVNKGIFFTAFTVASVLVRFGAGKVSDKHGRPKVIMAGLIVTSIALLVISEGKDIQMLLVGAGIYGIGTGILSPAISAWTIDMSNPEHRGKAVATMYISMELGIGSGALLGGTYYNDQINRIPQIIRFDIVVLFLGIVYLVFWARNKRKIKLI